METPDNSIVPVPIVHAPCSPVQPRRVRPRGEGERQGDAFEITGGVPLRGDVTVSGAKNAALPILAASILASEPVWVRNVPELTDVATLLAVLEELGIAAYRGGPGVFCLETRDSRRTAASYEWIRRMRAGICVLGPLLARRGRAEIPLPGGCVIGDRPIDLHLEGLRRMGATIRLRHGVIVAEAKRLRGAVVSMRGPHGTSVTGTANLLAAATLAEGTTTLRHAAKEPEIVDLGRFLVATGARIEGLGTRTIRVRGVERLSGCDYAILPDRIEAATFLLAAAATRGRVRVLGAEASRLTSVLAALRRYGIECTADARSVTVFPAKRLRSGAVTAEPYPGFPTDLQAPATALLSLAPGRGTVRDRVFPRRLGHVAPLRRLGAQIEIVGDGLKIEGVGRLSGAEVTATDLRCGAALVLAGLAAEGRTLVCGVGHLDRGYERFVRRLRRLGARIRRIQTPPAGEKP